MIYELLDTAAHPIVVVGTIETRPDTEDCKCGRPHDNQLKVVIEGTAPAGIKAMGLLSALSTVYHHEATDDDDRRMIRRTLAKLLEVTA